ncbi:MAG: phosphoglycerate dehydrogenase [Actinobacteria bacterium]|nr:phosphoglycerate dehydrogenase [Actinomycetota bacterium]
MTEVAATLPPRADAPAPPRVLVRERIADAGIELLRSRFDVDVDFDSDLEERIGDYDALIVRSATQVTRELLERADRLKVIGRAGVGVDNVDLDAASERGIIVANAPQSTVVSAAEHTLGLLLALSRNIPQAHAQLKQGKWERARFAGLELAGKTLGLAGFGRIGQQVARRANGLEMRVVAHDPYVAPSRFRDLGVEQAASLEELLVLSDFLSLHMTLTPDTRGAIGRAQLEGAKEGLRLVNVARGELVDEDALLEALRSGRVAGAALDVFSVEPYSGPLLELENVIVTPHLGASTAEAQDRAGVIVAEQVAAALEGGLVTNAVNMPAVSAEDLEHLRAFLPLAAALGALAVELAGGSPARLELTYGGALAERDTRLLTVAALNGAFKGRVEQPVNYVNAPLVARERGLEVHETSTTESPDYTSVVSVTAHGDGEPVSVAGTTIGREQRPQLVRALGYEIEVELDRLMLFAVNDDTPGMIGRLGLLLGEAGVNIANMAVSRNRREARALMALSIDSSPSDEVLERLREEPGFVDARLVVLPSVVDG